MQEKLIAEMRARIKEDDSSVPSYDNGYWYWRRFDTGADIPYCCVSGERRASGSLRGHRDVARPAGDGGGKPFYSLGGMAVSPDREWLA